MLVSSVMGATPKGIGAKESSQRLVLKVQDMKIN